MAVTKRSVLDYLRSIEGKQTLCGQHLSHRIKAAERGYRELVEALHQRSGKWVALAGAGYGWPGTTADETSAGNRVLARHWDAGGLVTLDWHPDNPWTGRESHDTSHRPLPELLDPVSDVYPAWMAELDRTADALAELRDAGVVVVWRPLHEATFHHAFWWACGWRADMPADHPPSVFRDLWQQMHGHFAGRGLDNLIWCYSAGNTDTFCPVDSLYPGGDYVDVVGVDIYADDLVPRGGQAPYERLLATGKLFALTEVGPMNRRDGTWDALVILDACERYPRAVFFQCWHSWTGNLLALEDNTNAVALMNDPRVATREDIQLEDDMGAVDDIRAKAAELRAVADELDAEAGVLGQRAGEVRTAADDLDAIAVSLEEADRTADELAAML